MTDMKTDPVAWLDKESGAIITAKLKPILCEDGFEIPLYAEQPAPVAPFDPDTVVCRRYTLEQSPGQNFYHYDIEPVYGSVPVTISDLIDRAENAPVAVVHTMRSVMEITQEASQFYVPGTSNWYDHIANRLNGVKP